VGLLISPENPDLIKLMRPLFYATPISSVSDLLFTRVLQDRPFVERFLADNRAALAEAYEFVAEWLIFHNLEYVKSLHSFRTGPDLINCRFTRANAAVFVVVDFAPFLERISPPGACPIDKLDLGVAALLREKVFMVCVFA
jgi:hypothetical protein